MTVAVPQQDEISITVNPDGVVVMLQKAVDFDQADSVIAVLPENVEMLIRALRAAKKSAQG